MTGHTSIFGANAQKGGQLTVRRALLAGNAHHVSAVRVEGEETSTVLEDVRIIGVQPRPLSETDVSAAAAAAGTNFDELSVSGLGVWVSHGANLSGRRVAIQQTTGFGLTLSSNGASAALDDLLVGGVTVHPEHPERGSYGILVQLTADLTANRTHIRDLAGFGLAVVGELPGPHHLGGAPSASLSGLTIEGITQVDWDEGAFGGIATVTVGPASADLSDFLIHDAALAGIVVARRADLRATDGVLQSNLIGLNIQDEEFRWEGALERVAFRDNGVDIDSVTAPIPSAWEALDAVGF